jgi:hypothetical protein
MSSITSGVDLRIGENKELKGKKDLNPIKTKRKSTLSEEIKKIVIKNNL